MAKKTEEETKAETVKAANSVHFLFLWKSVQSDARQYKPSNPLLEPATPIKIRVDVPLDTGLIFNASPISIAQLSNQAEPEPILTPLGMRYIIDQLEAVMQPAKEEKAATSEDEFVEEPEKVASKDEEWEDEAETSDTSDDEKADFNDDDEWND